MSDLPEPNIRSLIERGIYAGCSERLVRCGGKGRRSGVPVYPNGRGSRFKPGTVGVRIPGRVPSLIQHGIDGRWTIIATCALRTECTTLGSYAATGDQPTFQPMMPDMQDNGLSAFVTCSQRGHMTEDEFDEVVCNYCYSRTCEKKA